MLFVASALSLLTHHAFAQATKPAAKPAAKPGAAKDGPPPPEDMTLETKDGVAVRCTFYPGTKGKKAIPFILIHGWEGQRGDFKPLALHLQFLGHAVIVPDLRGHGQSLTYKTADGETKDFVKLDRFRLIDMEAMVLDVEACKRVLLEENNEGKLNIESLCVVGSEFGCILALKWAARDWSAPILPAFKQGQDVKALILLSPTPAYKGFTYQTDAMKHPVVRGQLSTLIVAGLKDPKGNAEAKRLHKQLQAFHADLPDDKDQRIEKQDLYLITPETSLSGTKLLERGLVTAQAITVFIDRRLIAKESEFAWTDRKSPL